MAQIVPQGGAKELLKSKQGREYLAKLQAKYKNDLLQPSDPKFKQQYAQKLKLDADRKHSQEQESKAMWEKREWEKKKKGVNPKYF